MRLAHIAALSLFLTASAFAQDTTILAYHEVDPVPERGWAVSSEDFADQMRYLALAGYNVIPISDLVDCIAGRRESLLPTQSSLPSTTAGSAPRRRSSRFSTASASHDRSTSIPKSSGRDRTR